MFCELAIKIFEAFSIGRWQDLIRPFNLVQMDMAAEHMMLCFIIAKYEEKNSRSIDYLYLIKAGLFDLLKKIALCDIKSPVLDMIKGDYPFEYTKLQEWVALQYKDLIKDKKLYSDFVDFLEGTQENTKSPRFILTRRVSRAAHKYASFRELQMIENVNEVQRWQKIEKELFCDLQQYLDLEGLQLLVTKQKPFDLLMKIEQLRFQTRWNQTQRLPATSVLGHCYFVAVLVFLLSIQNPNMCEKRLYNNFFCALFHDLPEAVTRDIISPVKQATDDLSGVIKMIESKVTQKELLPFVDDFYKDELLYFIQNEFQNRVILGGAKKEVPFSELDTVYNKEEFCPVDGCLVRLCDHIAAFLEAQISINSGVTSRQLASGRDNLKDLYKAQSKDTQDAKIINFVNATKLFSLLDETLCR